MDCRAQRPSTHHLPGRPCHHGPRRQQSRVGRGDTMATSDLEKWITGEHRKVLQRREARKRRVDCLLRPRLEARRPARLSRTCTREPASGIHGKTLKKHRLAVSGFPMKTLPPVSACCSPWSVWLQTEADIPRPHVLFCLVVAAKRNVGKKHIFKPPAQCVWELLVCRKFLSTHDLSGHSAYSPGHIHGT